jgi:hypothetical protein
LRSRSHDLSLTVVGLSRGAIGALMLARRLSGIRKVDRLRLNLCLFDPVPGNLVTTVRFLDWFRLTTASAAMDVSHAPIERVLAVYPYEPLPDLAFHAPCAGLTHALQARHTSHCVCAQHLTLTPCLALPQPPANVPKGVCS